MPNRKIIYILKLKIFPLPNFWTKHTSQLCINLICGLNFASLIYNEVNINLVSEDDLFT